MASLDEYVEACRVADHQAVPLIGIGAIQVREDRSEAFLNGASLPLTFAQRCILLELVRRGGKVARRDELYERAFGRRLPTGSRAVDIHVGRIRRALGSRADAIVSVGRVGYRIEPARLRIVPVLTGG